MVLTRVLSSASNARLLPCWSGRPEARRRCASAPLCIYSGIRTESSSASPPAGVRSTGPAREQQGVRSARQYARQNHQCGFKGSLCDILRFADARDQCHHRSSRGGATGSYTARQEAPDVYNLRCIFFSYVPRTPWVSEGAPVESKTKNRQQETRRRIRSAQVDARVAPRPLLRRRSTYRSPASSPTA